MNLSSPLSSWLKRAYAAFTTFRRPRPTLLTCRLDPPTCLRQLSLLLLATLGLICVGAIHAADISMRPRDPVLSGDAFSAGFVRTDGTVDPSPLNGTNGDILRNIPGYSRQRLWFSRGVIPRQGGPQFGTCPPGIAQFEHVQDIQPIGDWSKGSGYIFVSHSQHKFGHLFVLKTSQVAPPPNEHELYGFHGVNSAPPDGAGVWHHRLDLTAPEQWYNHPGDLAAVGNILLVTAENWKGESVCELERVNNPATGRPPEDAILFYDVANPELPAYLGKIPVSKLPVPLERINSLNAARIGDKYFLMVGPLWFESDTMVPDPSTWKPSTRAVVGAFPGFSGTVTVHSSDTGLEETWLLDMDSSKYHARQLIVTDSQLIFPPASREYDVDEGVVAPIVIDGPIGRTLQVLNGVHVTRRGRMAYVSCAAGFGVRRIDLLGIPFIGEIDEDVLEVDVHAIHYAGDAVWPAGFEVLPPLTALSDAGGWGAERYYTSIQTGDINGDGRAEILGRGRDGLAAWEFNGLGWAFKAPMLIPFTDDAEWDEPRYYSTIQTGDIDGDGRSDLLARSYHGFGTFRFQGPLWDLVPSRLAYADYLGWKEPKYYSTIQTADVDGDGSVEILARSVNGLEVRKLRGARHRVSNPNRKAVGIDSTRALPSVVWDDFDDGVRLEQTDHVAVGPWIPAAGNLTHESDRFALPLPLEIPQRFYRLRMP